MDQDKEELEDRPSEDIIIKRNIPHMNPQTQGLQLIRPSDFIMGSEPLHNNQIGQVMSSYKSSIPSGSDQLVLSEERQESQVDSFIPSKMNLDSFKIVDCDCVPKVLIVDDNSFNLMPIKYHLNKIKIDFNMVEEYNNECKSQSKDSNCRSKSSMRQSESLNMENLSINSVNQNF